MVRRLLCWANPPPNIFDWEFMSTEPRQTVEFPVPLGEIDDIVCRHTPPGTFPEIGPDGPPMRRMRFSVDVFFKSYDPPRLTPDGYQGPTWTLKPSGKPTVEEIPEDPHARHP